MSLDKRTAADDESAGARQRNDASDCFRASYPWPVNNEQSWSRMNALEQAVTIMYSFHLLRYIHLSFIY
jgi:hypothetical protein